MRPFTVAIGTYDCLDGFERCLRAVLASPANTQQIIVMDGGDSVRQETLPTDVKLIKLFNNPGLAVMQNLIRRDCATDDLIWIDDEAVVGPESLGVLASIPEEAGMGFLVDPVTKFAGGFCCFNWRKAAWEKLGGFDEHFWPSYYTDADYTQRYIASGLPREWWHIATGTIAHVRTKPHDDWLREAIDANRYRFCKKWGRDPDLPGNPHDGCTFKYPWGNRRNN